VDKLKLTLRAARTNRGHTLKDVARLTGRSIDTINRYEIDSSRIPRDLVEDLLNLYQVNGDLIFFGKESDFTGKSKHGKHSA
jgi:transcriptional regulator with XRE-family HTH domain